MKALQKLEDSISTLVQRQEDFFKEQGEVNGKLIRAIHGEPESDNPGLIKRMQRQEKKTKTYDRLIWIATGVWITIEGIKYLIK